MEYKTVEQLGRVAEVHVDQPVLSRIERLRRWAELLELQPDRQLRTLFQTEYQGPTARDALRNSDSPISVAFADPILRAAGLKDDTYGEAKRFFEITDGELHDVLCFCHHGAGMAAVAAARAVRGLAAKAADPGVVGWVRRRLDWIV